MFDEGKRQKPSAVGVVDNALIACPVTGKRMAFAKKQNNKLYKTDLQNGRACPIRLRINKCQDKNIGLCA